MASQADLETLKRIYEAWSEGDWHAAEEALSDDVVFVVDDPAVGPSTYHGRDGATTYTREYLSAWRHIRHVAEEFIENGDCVFVAVRHKGVGKHSGVELEERVFAVWTFRDGKVVRLEYFQGGDRGAALGAAGLQK